MLLGSWRAADFKLRNIASMIPPPFARNISCVCRDNTPISIMEQVPLGNVDGAPGV